MSENSLAQGRGGVTLRAEEGCARDMGLHTCGVGEEVVVSTT